MRLVKADIKYISNKYKPGKTQAIVMEFVNSDMDCAEVVDHDCKNAWICTCTLNKAIKTLKVNGVTAFSKEGHTYLVKEKRENTILHDDIVEVHVQMPNKEDKK